ncbi:DNA alkylation repair protein [Candidatus Parcubacteria bacterium]|nr:MAG: DNA alkylation repair protein [Candidatus Parcubacteria bacterium]
MTSQNLVKELKKYSSASRKKSNEWFFKTGFGQYGYGDQFIGVRVPDVRKVAQQFLDLDFKEVNKLINSPIHEIRQAAILILVEKNKLAIKNKDKVLQKKILNFYLKNRKQVNNWDLVDLSVGYILGQAILDGLLPKKILYSYAKSRILWERRFSIVATSVFIKQGDITDCLKLSRLLFNDREDLMHKAVGWMLRESWKKDAKIVERFLETNYKNIPRTALRYAIERVPERRRKNILKGKFR